MGRFNSVIYLFAVSLAVAITGCGGAATNSPNGNSTQPNPVSSAAGPSVPALVTVAPSTAQVDTDGSFQFIVNVVPPNASNSVSWTVSGNGCSAASCGTIDGSGHYLAPSSAPTPPMITVTATSAADQSKSGTAAVTIGRPSSSAVTFLPTGNMTAARAGHTSTLLLDGRVLIAGGDDSGLTAELYDPASGTFGPTGSMSESHSSQVATLLGTGQVLIAGGGTAELYDPATDLFTATAAMLAANGFQTATLLANGKVLVAGDVAAELYDPASGTFHLAGGYASDGPFSTATALSDGRVLLVGNDPSQIYDPSTNTFSVSGTLAPLGIYGIELQSATLLNNGKVLIAGGSSDVNGRLIAAELFDPARGIFSPTSNMNAARDAHAAVLLSDGRVLIVGGDTQTCNGNFCEFSGSLASAELYDPSTGSFVNAGNMSVPRSLPQATLLKNGDVLVTGGFDYCGISCFKGSLATAEIFHPQ